ncbi:MAG: hypothetical protein HRU21_12415, partial [Pseudomonadales bacterium]|nr:hypothetical protein [Pseudomonadales bacterium]
CLLGFAGLGRWFWGSAEWLNNAKLTESSVNLAAKHDAAAGISADKSRLTVKTSRHAESAKYLRLKHALSTSSVRGSIPDRPILRNPGAAFQAAPAWTLYFNYLYSLRSEFNEAELIAILRFDVAKHYPAHFVQPVADLFQRFLRYKKQLAVEYDALSEQDVDYFMLQPSAYGEFKATLQQAHFSSEEQQQLFQAHEVSMQQLPRAQFAFETYQQFLTDNSRATELYGSEAAIRLEQLKRNRQRWDQRLREYAQIKDSLLSNQEIDEISRLQQLSSLLADNFSPLEQKRVQALEAAGYLLKF